MGETGVERKLLVAPTQCGRGSCLLRSCHVCKLGETYKIYDTVPGSRNYRKMYSAPITVIGHRCIT